MIWRRAVSISLAALLTVSIVIAHVPDDWSTFDHRTFAFAGAEAGDLIVISTENNHFEKVKLPGVAPMGESAREWLKQRLTRQKVTLLLESPQTRDAQGNLRAFVFCDNQNLSVDLVKAGLAYADRREKTEMDGLIDAAEDDARRKKRGAWAKISFEQMPAWRQAWMKSLPTFGAK